MWVPYSRSGNNTTNTINMTGNQLPNSYTKCTVSACLVNQQFKNFKGIVYTVFGALSLPTIPILSVREFLAQ